MVGVSSQRREDPLRHDAGPMSPATSTPRNPQPRREVATYLVLAYSLATAVAVALPHADVNLLLSVLVPTVTVGILTAAAPRGSRRALWAGIGLGRAGLRAWPSALMVPLVLCAGAYGVAVLLGAGRLDVDAVGAGGPWVIDLVVSAVAGTVLILGEEIGWRGYLLPRMQQLAGDRRRAALLTGFAHGCFHLPLILIGTTYDTGVPVWVAAPVAVAVITAGGVFYAWLWDRTHAVWPVAVAHNCVNTVFDLGAAAVVATGGTGGIGIAYVAGETGLATLGVVVLLAVVLWRRAGVWQAPAPAPGASPSHGPSPRRPRSLRP